MALLKRQSSLSCEFVQAEMRAELDGLPHDPTVDLVFMAFTALDADPLVGDWNVGQWETDEGPIPTYYASCLVGPGGTIVLSKGMYSVWVRATEFPEVPVIKCGVLEVY